MILLLGTCNPVGEAEDYNGLYFTDNELQKMHAGGDLKEIPVKQEHTSTTVGKVVSTLLDNHGNLQCILDIDENTIEGGLAAGFVRDGVASELSLGYIVDVQNSNDKLTAQKKQVVEVSLVRKGARQNCHIHAYESQDAALVWKKGVDSCLPVYYTEFEIKNTTLSQTEIPQIIANFIAVFVDDVISVQNISVSST